MRRGQVRMNLRAELGGMLNHLGTRVENIDFYQLSKTTTVGAFNAIVKPTVFYDILEWTHMYVSLPHIPP